MPRTGSARGVDRTRSIPVVIAHGRAEAFDIRATVQQQWGQALEFGLERIHSRFAGRLVVTCAFFGDLWRPDLAHPRPTFRTQDDRVVWLTEGLDPHVEVSGSAEPPMVRESLVGEVADFIDHVGGLALGKFLDQAIPDVMDYLTKADLRAAANERLTGACTAAGAKVLVGFSMGSIIGYEVLRTVNEHFPAQYFLTSGAPLGMKPIHDALRAIAGGETPYPAHVRLWANIWSDSDAATGVHGDELAALFPAPPGRRIQEARNWGIVSTRENVLGAHNPIDYLSSLAMATALHTALTDFEP